MENLPISYCSKFPPNLKFYIFGTYNYYAQEYLYRLICSVQSQELKSKFFQKKF
jgi:hypothetical protein